MIGMRIKEYRKMMGATAVEFAKLAEISQGSLSGIENMKTKPAADTIAAIVRNTDINPMWLLTGEGPIKREETVQASSLTEEILETAIEVAEELLESLDKRATPKQRTQLILALYDLASEREDHIIDRPTALRLVKLMAA